MSEIIWNEHIVEGTLNGEAVVVVYVNGNS